MIPLLLLLAASDPVLENVEQAFDALAAGEHAKARRLLERATPAFDERALEGSALKKAFVSDGAKPWRGLAPERELAFLVLGALDVERGRCDLAIPSFQSALFHHKTKTEPVLARTLLAHCLAKAGEDGEGAAALASSARLVVGDAVIRLSRSAPRTRAAGRVLWIRASEEAALPPRPFDKTLQERKQQKEQARQQAQRQWTTSTTAAQQHQWLGALVTASAASGSAAMAGAIDDRADARRVRNLPAQVILVE